MFRKFAIVYNRLLNRYTYPVQMVSAGAMWFSGDLLCQYLVSHLEDRKEKTDIDWNRALRMTCYGTFFSAPIYSLWFGALERISLRIFSGYSAAPVSSLSETKNPLAHSRSRLATILSQSPTFASRMWKITFFKTILDVIIFDPFYLSFFFIVNGLMEQTSLKDIGKKLEHDLTSTYVADVLVWLPIQLANFRYVSVIYQPIVVQGANLFWNTFLSWVQHKPSS